MPSVSQYKYNRKKTKINKKLGLDLLSWDMASLRVLFCSCRPLNPVLPIIALKNSPDSLIMPATLPLKHICHLRKNLQYKNQWKNIHPFPTPYYIFVRRGGGRIALAWIVLLPNCIFLFCQGSGKKFVVGWVLKPILMLSFGLSQAGQFMNLLH